MPKPGLPPLARRELRSSVVSMWCLRSTSARAERTGSMGSSGRTCWVYLRSRGENPSAARWEWRATGLPPLARREQKSDRGHELRHGSTSARAERTHQAALDAAHEAVYLRSRGENSDGTLDTPADTGLPPLARREQRLTERQRLGHRSTSARAERTRTCAAAPRRLSVYLRSRGENASPHSAQASSIGLPPLARREQVPRVAVRLEEGSTSARAERTRDVLSTGGRGLVYLRSRGENPIGVTDRRSERGLPPLARRERAGAAHSRSRARSTSARAERTASRAHPARSGPVYLRSRGENENINHRKSVQRGLPPLARREPHHRSMLRDRAGSTSARAERTLSEPLHLVVWEVYLRSRGENHHRERLRQSRVGLPPLARRERLCVAPARTPRRSTSARAERTPASCHPTEDGTVYLRSRGENAVTASRSSPPSGLPPLARRELQQRDRRCERPGSTSARAERTLNPPPPR